MARYTNDRNQTWTYADGLPDFNAWLAADPARTKAWEDAGKEYDAYKAANGGKEPEQSASGEIFTQWIVEVDAMVE